MRKGLFSLPLFFIFLDFVVKYITTMAIPPLSILENSFPFGGIPIFEDLFGISFSLNYIENQGAAWGLFAGYQDLLLLFRLAVIGFLFIYILSMKKENPHHFPILLIFSGAVGNVIDYFLYGHVVDMFHFVFWGYSFPIFNIADSLITLGALWFIALAFLEKKEKVAEKNA